MRNKLLEKLNNRHLLIEYLSIIKGKRGINCQRGSKTFDQTIPFLFAVIDMNATNCTGCGACWTACPTGALRISEVEGSIKIEHAHYLCIACGRCSKSCPEKAMAISPKLLLKELIDQKVTVINTHLTFLCKNCGISYSTINQINRVKITLKDTDKEKLLQFCPSCRQRLNALLITGRYPNNKKIR